MAKSNIFLNCRSFQVQKHGNSPDEYEDACEVQPGLGVFAIADGASESSYAREWADILVKGFMAKPCYKQDFTNWLSPLKVRWEEQVRARKLPWYAEFKRQQGAYSTFLGLVIRRRSKRWFAFAVGDSCVFRVRNGILLKPFPISNYSDFSNHPPLIGTCATDLPPPQRASGKWVPSDQFYLMTDALAQWFLHRHQMGERPWEEIDSLCAEPAASFQSWIFSLRNQGDLKNDDTTLVRIVL